MPELPVATAPIPLTPTPILPNPTSDLTAALTLAAAVSAMEIDSGAGNFQVPAGNFTAHPEPSTVRQPSPAIAGPGPTTMANQIMAAITEVSRTFRDMDEHDEYDDEGEAAIQMMDALGEPARIVKGEPENSDMEVDELEGDAKPRMNGKGKGRQGPKVEDSDTDWDQYMRSPKSVIKPRHVRRSTAATGLGKYVPRSRPTGDYFDPPCSTCHIAGKVCEQDVRGGSCSGCKASKRACEYARPRTSRRVKSKPTVVDSEDDGKHGFESEAEHQSAPRVNPRTPRPRRAASKRAMQAIRGEIVIKPLQPLVPVEKKPSTRRRAAVKTSKGKPIRICINYHDSLTSVAVRQSSPSQLVEDPFDLVTARLQRLTENAERALAVPRESQLEGRIRQCEDFMDRIQNVVLTLCESMGIVPEGLHPAVVVPPADVLPAIPLYVERGVGPEQDENPNSTGPMSNAGEADGTFELDIEMAAPSAPTGAGGVTPNPPPSTVPNLNLIPPTPQTPQDDAAAVPIPLQLTPPHPLPSLFGLPHPPIDLEEMPGSQGHHRQESPPPSPTVPPPTSLSECSPPPPPDTLPPPLPPARSRSRSQPPLPPFQDTLAVPATRGMMTRSRTRSPSPGVVETAGSKRKNDGSGDESDPKRRRV